MYEKENFKFPNLILRPSEETLLKWYFIVYDLKETEFENGVYYGIIDLDPEYPLKPPHFKFYTPNGRFETNTKICTTFSGFHKDTYTSTWNIMTMMEGMISFMTENGTGIGSLNSPIPERKQLASNSLEWNKKQSLFNKVFPDINLLVRN
jgi:ubiquitin-conjugating enzyme E2 J2